MEDALRIILPVYLVVYFAVAFVWRSVVVYKTTGINPYVLGGSDNAYDYIGVVFRLTFLALVGVIILFSGFSSVYDYAAPIVWLERDFVRWLGLVLLVGSLVWTAIAQFQMGASWRIGIDTKNRTELVEKGLFAVSRNPIFLGMRLALAGFFLTIPNAVTLLTMVLGDVLMQIQVRLEEEHLKNLHGEKYAEFCRKVRRWI
jgi:protein-S-isoprenylcysteine O-methyltransferase Ste14